MPVCLANFDFNLYLFASGQEDLPACNGFYPPQLRLLMYVIGGREVGQVMMILDLAYDEILRSD